MATEKAEITPPGVPHDKPLAGALARGTALIWKLPEWWRVVRVWGQRCAIAEYDDGTTRCAKCKALGFIPKDDDD